MTHGSIRSDARKRREHVISQSGEPGQKQDTARTIAQTAHTILATISLHDDNQRERENG